MSHISDMKTKFNNLDALEKAAALHHGGKLIRGAKTYKWVGTWYGDSPVPRSLFGKNEAEYHRVCAMGRQEQKDYMEALLGKCDHKIVFPGHKYEVGVVNVDGDYTLVWDWATPLNDIMGFMYDNGQENLGPLAPFLANYQQFNWEASLGHYHTGTEVYHDANNESVTFVLHHSE